MQFRMLNLIIILNKLCQQVRIAVLKLGSELKREIKKIFQEFYFFKFL